MAYLRISSSPFLVSRDQYAPVYEIVKEGNREKFLELPIRAMITDEEPNDLEPTLLCIHPGDLRVAVARLARFPQTSIAILDKQEVSNGGMVPIGFNGVPAASADFYIVFGEQTKVAISPFALIVGHAKGERSGGAAYDFGKALVAELKPFGIGDIFHPNELNVPSLD